MRSGLPRRAATIFSGSRVDTTAMPYVPSTWLRAASTARSSDSPARPSPPSKTSSIRCTSTSVSVSEVKVWPRSWSFFRSVPAFSMMPLCTRAKSPSSVACGWALRSVGGPCVAQRVWPMPYWPRTGSSSSDRSSSEIFPASLRTWIWPSSITATPAESYPRYSRRFRPSMRRGVTWRAPI
jgi:hypothetical protein